VGKWATRLFTMDTGLYLIREEFYPTDLLQPVLRNFSILEVIKRQRNSSFFMKISHLKINNNNNKKQYV
jgi:hypothetical protein